MTSMIQLISPVDGRIYAERRCADAAMLRCCDAAMLKANVHATIARRLGIFDKVLTGQDYLTGAQFSVADAYLFTIVNWSGLMAIDLTPWPAVSAFQKRVGARPAVQQALKAEGLI